MAIPINIEKILNGYTSRNAGGNATVRDRIEFLEYWDPDNALKTISAFANDIDNRSGGYLVIGAREENGRAVRPVSGLEEDQLNAIQQDILRCCGLLQPVYLPEIQQAAIDGKWLILVWCPGGYERPYLCPKKPSAPSQENSEMVYYIRRMAGTIEATEPDVKELLSLSHNIPFDDRMNPSIRFSETISRILKAVCLKVPMAETISLVKLLRQLCTLRTAPENAANLLMPVSCSLMTIRKGFSRTRELKSLIFLMKPDRAWRKEYFPALLTNSSAALSVT